MTKQHPAAADDSATTEIQRVALPVSIAAVTVPTALYLRAKSESKNPGDFGNGEAGRFLDVSARRRKRIKKRDFLARADRFVGRKAFRSELGPAWAR